MKVVELFELTQQELRTQMRRQKFKKLSGGPSQTLPPSKSKQYQAFVAARNERRQQWASGNEDLRQLKRRHL